MRSLRRQVLTHDVDRWAAAFLSSLERTRDHLADAMSRLPDEVIASISQISETERLLVATDFDGGPVNLGVGITNIVASNKQIHADLLEVVNLRRS